jgi:sodium pump decarboxylase gamma subunit
VNLYIQGLTISIVGISLTFLALGLLILAMILLERFFRDGKPAEPAEAAPEEISVTVQDTEDEEIAAVIATALAHRRSISQSGLGATLEAGVSPWWAMGRAQQCPSDALQKTKGRR